MANKEYRFVPAYYEWHLIDEEGNILLNWDDPIEELCDLKTIDDVWAECNHFVEAERVTVLEEGFESLHGNTAEMLNKLPDDKIFLPIMAEALFYAYCA